MRPAAFKENNGNTIAFVQRLTEIEFNGCKLSFVTPNPVTLLYNKSWKEFEKAKRIVDDVIQPFIVGKDEGDLENKHHAHLFDYFECIQTSVICIYSAVEALSNVAIPKDFTLSRKNSRGIEEIWNKPNIEKWFSTEEKIADIVPEILKMDTPKKMPFWERFTQLKRVRDDIIHPKHAKNDAENLDADMLSTLLDESIFAKIMSGFQLIQFFCEKNKAHFYFPIIADGIPVDVIEVESFDGTFSVSPS